jgi:hypothetical protein
MIHEVRNTADELRELALPFHDLGTYILYFWTT